MFSIRKIKKKLKTLYQDYKTVLHLVKKTNKQTKTKLDNHKKNAVMYYLLHFKLHSMAIIS